MTDKNKKQILDDVKLKHDYYKIERVYSIKITKSFILAFTDNEGNFNWERLKVHRHSNFEKGIPLNHGFPIMEEEIKEIIKRNSEGRTVSELESYFQRPLKTIAKIIENFSNPKDKQKAEQKDEKSILKSIIYGHDPYTKKPFQLQSVWNNSTIIRDLKNWSGINVNENSENASKNKVVKPHPPKRQQQTNLNIVKKSNSSSPKCVSCNQIIPYGRIMSEPLTKLCVKCAPNEKKRKIRESWGSRADWKRDRSSWKRSH